MAFTVTPTSGAAPYSLSAIVDNKENIDGISYVASVWTSVATGTCPLTGTATPVNVVLVDQLINSGTVILPYVSVDPGTCRTFTLRIMRAKTNVVIASSNATVDNV